jgi:hypothetical protein
VIALLLTYDTLNAASHRLEFIRIANAGEIEWVDEYAAQGNFTQGNKTDSAHHVRKDGNGVSCNNTSYVCD